MEKPLNNKILVNIIGSKKNPILPTNLDETLGIDIESIFLQTPSSGKTIFFLLFGKNNKNIKMDKLSEKTFNKINPATLHTIPLLNKNGKKNIIKR